MPEKPTYAELEQKILELEKKHTGGNKAEDEEEKMESRALSILNSLPNMVALVSLDTSVKYISPSITRILGYLPEDVIGESIYNYLHPDDMVKIMQAVDNAISNGTSGNQRFRYRKADGDHLWVEAHGDLVFNEDEKIVGAVFYVFDITNQKAVEDNLNQRINQLDASLQKLELEHRLAVQEEKMVAIGNFMASFSREIGAPLDLGLTTAFFLEGQAKEVNDNFSSDVSKHAEIEQYLLKISESSSLLNTYLKRIAGLVSNLELMAADQSDKKDGKFNLKAHIQKTVDEFTHKFQENEHRIDVNCPDDLIIFSYPDCFSQILTSLIKNSLMHGFEGKDNGTVSIEVTKEKESLLLKYKDNGRGMKKDTIKKMYEPFSSAIQGRGRSGLGMYIVYNMVTQKLNGQIECESAPDNGTQFLITVPLKKD